MSNPPAAPEVMQASLAQLTKFPAEILRLHLTSRHLASTGMKATMARRLSNAIHPIASSSTSATSTLPTSKQDTAPIRRHCHLERRQFNPAPPGTASIQSPPGTASIQPTPGTASIQPPPGIALIQPPPRTPSIQPPQPEMAELAALFSQYLHSASSSGQVPAALSPASPVSTLCCLCPLRQPSKPYHSSPCKPCLAAQYTLQPQ